MTKFFTIVLEIPMVYNDGAITQMIYEESECGSYCESERYSTFISVLRNTSYEIQIEILKNDLVTDDKKIAALKVDGTLIGNCYSSGENDVCSFYDCSFHLTSKHIISSTGVLEFEFIHSKHSQNCSCDKETWICEKANTTLSQIKVAARITLTPIGRKIRLLKLKNKLDLYIFFILCLDIDLNYE